MSKLDKVIARLLGETWYLHGQPWCHSEDAGKTIISGDMDPQVATFIADCDDLSDVRDLDELDEGELGDVSVALAHHIVDLHNKTLEDPAPIPMVIHCPECGLQHIDASDPEKGWFNPPHKSHLCARCLCVWRVADVPTTGVAHTETVGDADTWAPPMRCRECGCTDEDCSECVETTGEPCYWVEPELCSRCQNR